MKILRIIYDWPPPWDGLAPGPYELTKAQVEVENNEVRVICGWWPKAAGAKPIPKVKLLRLLREPIKGTLLILMAPYVLLIYLWQVITWKPDIIHSHGHFGLYVYVFKLLFGWLDKTPLVLHLHNTVAGRREALLKQEGTIWWRPKFLRWPLSVLSDKFGIRVAKAVICCSQLVKEEVFKYHSPSPEKVFLVENGVNTKLFSPQGENMREELGLEGAKVIFYNGALTARKNVDLIVQSLEFLSIDYKLLIVGRGSTEQELEELVTDLGVEDRVLFQGYHPYPNLPPYFRTADVFVLPASYEGLPKVVLQALSCGIPVVGSGFSLSEDLEGLVTVQEPSPAILAQEIKKVIESGVTPDVKKIKEIFDWSVKGEQVEEVYRACLNQK